MSTTTLVLIRHGQTDWNIDNRYQGNSPTPLNATGIAQAAELAASMRGERWDVLVSSPLPRALFTALAIADELGVHHDDVLKDDLLMERSYGVAEGYTLAEREVLYPGDHWEGLESRESLEHRAITAIERYRDRFRGGSVALVTHGTWITSVLNTLSNGEHGYGKSVILNTSRTYLTHHANGWQIGAIGVADHLAALS